MRDALRRKSEQATPIRDIPTGVPRNVRKGTVPARLRALGFALCAIALLLSCQRTESAGNGPRFPTPERPVAPILSPAYLDEQTRDAEREAERVMDRMGIRPGTRVADIGAGEGYYTVRLARRLGPSATLYAEDVRPDYLAQLSARLRQEGIQGVRLVLGLPRDPRLSAAAIDVAILAHVYHEIENPYEFLYRLRPALVPGARIGIVEADRSTPEHGTPPALLRCELAAVGYRQVDFMPLVPPDTYLAVFVPPDELLPPEAMRPCRP